MKNLFAFAAFFFVASSSHAADCSNNLTYSCNFAFYDRPSIEVYKRHHRELKCGEPTIEDRNILLYSDSTNKNYTMDVSVAWENDDLFHGEVSFYYDQKHIQSIRVQETFYNAKIGKRFGGAISCSFI